jgi:hypothetical protein
VGVSLELDLFSFIFVNPCRVLQVVLLYIIFYYIYIFAIYNVIKVWELPHSILQRPILTLFRRYLSKAPFLGERPCLIKDEAHAETQVIHLATCLLPHA